MARLADVMNETHRILHDRQRDIVQYLGDQLVKNGTVLEASVRGGGEDEPTLTVRIGNSWFYLHCVGMAKGSNDPEGLKAAFLYARASAQRRMTDAECQLDPTFQDDMPLKID